MKKKEKLIPETESVIPEAESAETQAPEAVVEEPVVSETPAVAAEPVAEPVAEEAVAAEGEASPVAEAEQPAAVEDAPQEETAAEESEPASETEDSNAARGKKKKERAPKQPKAPKKRKSMKGLVISLVAILLVAAILAGGYFLGFFDKILGIKSVDDYFTVAEKQTVFGKVDRFDGEIIDYSREHNLVAVKSTSVNTSNYRKIEVKIYDTLTGKELKNYYVTENLDRVRSTEYDVDFSNYPMVLTTETSYYEDSYGGWDTNVYYNLAVVKAPEDGGKNRTMAYVHSTSSDEGIKVKTLYNGMTSFVNTSVVSYYDKNGNHLRDEKLLFSDTYTSQVEYDAEFGGKLYAWNFDDAGVDRRVQIFNTDGICLAQYNHNAKTAMQPFVAVLNNGNVFIQEMRVTEEKDYDLLVGDLKLKLYEMIMDATTGAITDLDLDFMVVEMESAYGDDNGSDMYFKLKDEKYNQALVVMKSQTGLSAKGRYAVLDNEMNEVYAVAEEVNGMIEPFGSEHYVMATSMPDGTRYTVYDMKNEKVFTLRGEYSYHTDHLIESTVGLYNTEGKLVFDYSKNALTKGKVYTVTVKGNNLFLRMKNQVTGSYEDFLFDRKAKTFRLIADGQSTALSSSDGDYYVIRDVELNVYSLYNAKGEVVLKTQNNMNLTALDDTLLVQTSINGKPVCYSIHG